jgi:hypothetical protein
LPLDPAATVTHAAWLDAVQLQPVSVSTWTAADPPAGATASDALSTLNVHGAPACEMSTRADATEMPPRRAAGVAFGVTEYAIVDGP